MLLTKVTYNWGMQQAQASIYLMYGHSYISFFFFFVMCGGSVPNKNSYQDKASTRVGMWSSVYESAGVYLHRAARHLQLNLRVSWNMVLRSIVTCQLNSHWGKLGVNRGDDFLAHRKMDNSDGWNVMEKQKKPVLSKALHCVRVKKSVLWRRAPLQKWLTAFPTKASFPKHMRQANLINRV